MEESDFSGETMLIAERRHHILTLIQRHGRALTADLAGDLNISRITIRKDLEFLQDQGLIQRTHGGALANAVKGWPDLSLSDKEKLHVQEKQRIAKAAVQYVSEGQSIILDSGSTTNAVARALRHLARLTVITNGVNIAAELSNTDFEIILTGGALRKNSFSLVGPLAEDVVRSMRADIFFLGADGVDLETGMTTPDVSESRVGRAMVDAAKTVIAVVDSSKFGKQSLASIVPLSKVDIVITDINLDPRYLELLRSEGLTVNLV